MGLGDKIQKTVGKAKENVSEVVGNQGLRVEGQGNHVRGSVGQIVDNVKEKFGSVVSGVADKVEEAKDKLIGK